MGSRFPILLVAFVMALAGRSAAAQVRQTPVPAPVINKDSWILLEIWPDVKDITLSLYFLDSSFAKNKNLCEATKRSLDREADARSKELKRKFTSYALVTGLGTECPDGRSLDSIALDGRSQTADGGSAQGARTQRR